MLINLFVAEADLSCIVLRRISIRREYCPKCGSIEETRSKVEEVLGWFHSKPTILGQRMLCRLRGGG